MLTIDVSWSRSRQEVLVQAICTFTLPAHSQALASVREKGAPYCGGYDTLREGKAAGWVSSSKRSADLTQRSPDASAQAKIVRGVYLPRRSGPQDVTITLNVKNLVEDMPADAGFPTVWIVRVNAPKWSFGRTDGPVYTQTESAVVWRLDTAPTALERTAAVTRSVSLSRSIRTTGPPSTRHQTRGEMLTALTVAVSGIVVIAAFLVTGLAGAAVRRRWAVATLVLAVPVCLVGLAGIPAPLLSPDEAQIHINVSANATVLPGFVWKPGPLLGLWLWYVLPVAGWWFSCRAVTGRPPSWWVLFAGCLPPLLAFPLMAAGGTVPSTGVWLSLGLWATSLAGFLLVRLLCTGAIRRWLPTGTALLWLVGVTYWLSRSPIMSDEDPKLSSLEFVAVMVCTWPTAAWLTSLVGPVLRRPLRPVMQAVCFVVTWGMMTVPFVFARLASLSQKELDVWDTYRLPFFTGYAASPFIVLTVSGITLQIAYLWRRGAIGDTGRAVEPVGRVLLVCAALTAYGSPSLRTLTMWGEAIAVLLVAVASLILLPPGSAAATARLRRVSRRGHARFMDRWLTTQLLWDTRADFQRSARAALVDDMTVSDFWDRWHGMAVPGRNDDPESRLRRAKQFALGTNAGRRPWTAGLVGAGRAQLLALPWATYKAVSSGIVGADYFMPFHMDAMFQALRFTHWALYGFVYGYFYALLRGLTPVGKAAWLMLAVLPAEVLPMVPLTVDPQYAVATSWTDMATGCIGVAGQTLVLFMLLGLWWEWSLARAAGMKWSQVRNFRRLSSITVPVGTVLVAGATAFATTVAGTWAQPELKPPTSVESTQAAHQSEPANWL
ncbi:hypothetical protein [Streptomyces sp. NBC_00140]|uniref:hypothetical protein n=1 Tax=Streptomyces sp. NBC_00140 TaxID=2975664 RepID=UPI002258F847|nr:hypothetical protein [Streptomyces sp. NBC_00140]MCX5328447.1 hypothetical protein [Streptomyces sp. NBC_00140]